MAFNFSDRALVQIDPARNCYRFYNISIEPNLFGDHSVVIHWGRIGSRGSIRIAASGEHNEVVRKARRIEGRKCRSGYEPLDPFPSDPDLMPALIE